MPYSRTNSQAEFSSLKFYIFFCFNQKILYMDSNQQSNLNVQSSKPEALISRITSQEFNNNNVQQVEKNQNVKVSMSVSGGDSEVNQSLKNNNKESKESKSFENSKSMSKTNKIVQEGDDSQIGMKVQNKEIEKQPQNMKGFNEFTAAWKSEIDFGAVLMEKVSFIVQNYYQMLPELARANEQMELLIVYNTSLLEILNKFEDHQRKLMNRLKTVSQLYSQVMRELCSCKNKPFRAPQIKLQQSIFAKFNLNQLTYQPVLKKKIINQSYEKQLLGLFKQNLLLPMNKSLQKVNKAIQDLKAMDRSQKQQQISQKDDALIQLKQKIIKYQNELKNVNQENMFYLYNVKSAINKEMNYLGLIQGSESVALNKLEEENENAFVSQVYKIHVGLSNLQEQQIQNYIKEEKQIRKKIKKQRVKEQQKFVRACESIQSQNFQLTKDIKKLKQKIAALDNQLAVIKMEKDYKKMKGKSPLNLNRQSIAQQEESNNSEELKLSSSKRLAAETHKAMTVDLKKVKDENSKLLQLNAGYKNRQKTKAIFLNKMKQKAQKMQIQLNPKWEQIKIIEHLIAIINQHRNGKNIDDQEGKNEKGDLLNLPGSNKKIEQQLNSPYLEDGEYDLEKNQKQFCLETILQHSQFAPDVLQNRNRELEKQVNQLRRKNEININIITAKNQDVRKMLQEHQTTLRQKNSKINQLVKQYEGFQNQIKQLKFANQLLRVKNQFAQKLSDKIIKSVQQISVQDFVASPLPLIKEMLQKLRKNVEDYKIETKRQEQAYQQKRQISLLREGQRDQLSSRHGNLSDQSGVSLMSKFAKSKSKRQSDMMEGNKDQQQNSKNKLKNKKPNDKKIQVLEKELNLKKHDLKKIENRKSIQKQIDKSPNKQDSKQNQNQKAKSSSEVSKQKQLQIGHYANQIIKNKEELKVQPVKTINNLSFQQVHSAHKIKKTEIKSSTELGLLQVEPKNGYAEQNQFINQSKCNTSNKMEDSPKQLVNFLSLLENNQNDNMDCVSEQPKQSSRSKFFQQDPGKQKEMKKNKVAMNENLKGSLKLQMYSSKNQLNQKQDNEKIISQQKLQNLKQTNQKKQNQKISNNQKSISQSFQKKAQNKKSAEESDKSSEIKKERAQRINKVQKKYEDQQQKQQKKDKKKNKNMKTQEKDAKSIQNQLIDIKSNSSLDQKNIIPRIRINPVPQKEESELSIQKEDDKNNFKSGSNKVNITSQNQINNCSLNYSQISKQKISQIQSEKKYIKEKNLGKNEKKNKANSRISQIAVEEHQQIMARIQKLGDLDDALDFIELYNRYKQVIICLQQAEAQNRSAKLRYQKFVSEINLKGRTLNYSLQQQLYYLKELVQEQRDQIQQFDRRYYEDMIKNIKISGVYIKEHLAMMRDEQKLQREKQSLAKKLFI